MKLTVFGAVGATGEQIVRHGLAAGADRRLRVIVAAAPDSTMAGHAVSIAA